MSATDETMTVCANQPEPDAVTMTSSSKPRDRWKIRRIIVAVFISAIIACYDRAFDFWQVGVADRLRAFLDLAILLIAPAVALTMLVWLVSALIALFRRDVRRACSSVIAILFIPACVKLLLAISLLDPWYWYVTFNRVDLERQAAAHITLNKEGYVVLEERDITTGIAGLTPNHFVALIYSDADPIKLTYSVPNLTKIKGKFFRRDTFM